MTREFEYKGNQIRAKWRKANGTHRLWYWTINGSFVFSSYGSAEGSLDRAQEIIDDREARRAYAAAQNTERNR